MYTHTLHAMQVAQMLATTSEGTLRSMLQEWQLRAHRQQICRDKLQQVTASRSLTHLAADSIVATVGKAQRPQSF